MLNTDGLVDPQLSLPRLQPIAEIEVDLARAQTAGIKPGDVRRAAATLLQGVDVGFLFEQQKVFQVVVKGHPGDQSQPHQREGVADRQAWRRACAAR
ncbi:hypothetical protein ACW0JT_04770 [Arthrobacter sp. SA17]